MLPELRAKNSMIKKTELIGELAPFGKTAFGCRIQSAAEAYGLNEPFAQFWTQGDKAALCKLDDAVVLDAAGDADFTEITDFIRMTGAAKLLCSAQTAEQIGFPAVCHGQIMAYRNTVKAEIPAGFELNPSLREVHALLCESATATFVPPEFEPFYMDLSHRIRHGAAVAAGIRQGETLVSCAVCIAKTADKAVISAVAVKPEQQRRGYGRAVLTALASRLQQSEIYIFRVQDENEDFYRAFGFLPCGEFAELSV